MRGRREGTVAELIPVAAVEPDGLVVLDDGSLVRGFAVEPVNALVLDEPQIDQLTSQIHKLLARVPVGQSLAFYVDSAPLDAHRVVAGERAASDAVAAALADRGETDLARSTHRLATAQAQTLLTHLPAVPASQVRYLVLVPFRPSTSRRPSKDSAIEATTRAEHARYVSSVVAALKAMRLHARSLDGGDVINLLWERCSPTDAARGEPLPSRGTAGLDDICGELLDASSRSHLRWAQTIERVVRLAGPPEETWLGWSQYLTLTSLPFTLAVHVHGRDRYREKARQKRRYRQLWAANRGQERLGRLVDPDREDAEHEAHEVTVALRRHAAASVYDLSVYLAVREPTGDVDLLTEEVRTIGRELTSATGATLNEGWWAQRELWRSTLPLGIDRAARTRRYLSVNAADTFPLLGPGCGSPPGPTSIPIGYAQPGRELVRVDPFDPSHPNHVTVIAAQSGGGKTMLTNLLIGRAAAKGATGAIIDRSGHYDFAAASIPGAATVRVGGGDQEQRVNPWDGAPSASKIAFLVALHELIVGDGDTLGKLEQNLLGLAIRSVYRRCQDSGETPRETLLQEELTRRYRAARDDASPELAASYQLLAESLHNYVGDGPHAWLCDHETTFEAADAPLVVYDTRHLPDGEAPAALFVICEQIIRRVEAVREAFLAADADPLPWSGRSFLVFEEVWKLIDRQATGRWVNELARRSRHLALWLIAISQQLDDFAGPHAEALISQSTLRVILRQNPDRLPTLQEQLGLSHAAVEQIRELQTVKREYSQAYLINGGRGAGTVTITAADYEYWRSTSDPITDEPLRRLAQRHARDTTWHGAWRALQLLAEPAWHARYAAPASHRREAR